MRRADIWCRRAIVISCGLTLALTGSVLAFAAEGTRVTGSTTTVPWSFPGGCTQGQISKVVHDLVRDFNAGNAVGVNRLIAPKPAFQWFAVSGGGRRLGDKSKVRSTIEAYVRERHRHHARWVDLTFQGNLGLTLTIKSDDYSTIRRMGKGSVDCTTGRALLTVWAV